MSYVGTSVASLHSGEARRAQQGWAAQPIAARLTVLRRFREWLASNPAPLVSATAQYRGVPELESLKTEIMPLADACRWLEKNAAKVLSPRNAHGAASIWTRGMSIQINREPIGLVLIIAPSSFSLFLAGVQTIQALFAGNAVVLKPAPESTTLMTRFRDALLVAGLPMDLLTLLPENPDSVEDALFAAEGPDHVVLTGSVRTGRALQQVIAESARPISLTAELSGADVCLALPGARLHDVACALRYATSLNRGRSCVAPRLVLVPHDCQNELLQHLQRELTNLSADPYSTDESRRFAHILSLAVQLGAELVHIENSPVAVLRDLPLDSDFPWDDLFSPLLFVNTYRSVEEAIAIQRRMPLTLSATVFSSEKRTSKKLSREVAARLDSANITINDLVQSVFDPRIPFTACKASGSGVTRGAEGLLAMTTAKVVAIQHSRFRPHWEPPKPSDFDMLRHLLAFQHGALRHRFAALKGALRCFTHRDGRSSTTDDE